MILGMPPLSDSLAAFTCEVECSGIQKHKIQISEEIFSVIKHLVHAT
jgi:hypothetical protein